MEKYIRKFVDHVKSEHFKSPTKSKSKSKSKSRSKSKTKSKQSKSRTLSKASKKRYTDFNTLYNNLKINFLKVLFENKDLDYDKEIEKLNVFRIDRRGEGMALFITYKRKHYVFKIIYNINTDYDKLMTIQNKMAESGLSPTIYNQVFNFKKNKLHFMSKNKKKYNLVNLFGDTDVNKLMRNKKLVFIVMEFVDAYELRHYYDIVLKNMEFENAFKEIKRIVTYLNKFLKRLREIGVCHKDYTLDNILYNKKNNKFYLIDYGWSEFMKDVDCIQSEIDFILHTERPYYSQRIVALFDDFNKDFNQNVELIPTKDNYLKLKVNK